MKLLGITGGLGMGKSACGQLLAHCGVAVVDTDELARQIVQPGQPALDEVRDAFGGDFIGPDGRLRRGALAGLIFTDAAARARLESILHPPIRQLWQTQVTAWWREGRKTAAVIIPLLFETNAQASFDATICVACSAGTQRRRVLDRGWTEEQAAQRIAAQWPVEKKMLAADHVIWTEGGLDVHAGQLERVLTFG